MSVIRTSVFAQRRDIAEPHYSHWAEYKRSDWATATVRVAVDTWDRTSEFSVKWVQVGAKASIMN